MSAVEKAKVRKKPARNREVVLALMDERLCMLESSTSIEQVAPHTFRLRELLNELQRSLGRKDESADSE